MVEKWRGVLDELISSANDDPILVELIFNRFMTLTREEQTNVIIGLVARLSHYREQLEQDVQLR